MHNNLHNLDKPFSSQHSEAEDLIQSSSSFDCCGYTAETETASDRQDDGRTAGGLLSARYKRIQLFLSYLSRINLWMSVRSVVNSNW